MKWMIAAVLLCSAAVPGADLAWDLKLKDRIPLYGHRNWIVIADSAYPVQARDGIETIVSHENLVSVLKHVLAALDASKHVRPIVYTDKELAFINEDAMPGITPYKATLEDLTRNREAHTLPHEEIIHRLDEAGQTFRILVIKTNMVMPYTSVFLQLDCAYWGPEQEQKLRAAMAGK
jgi:hypothetical protein